MAALRALPTRIAALALAVLAACGSRDHHDDARAFADAVCTAADACGCALGPGLEDDCSEHLVDAYLAAHERGLRVKGDCFDEFLAALERDPCLAEPEWATAREECYAMTDDREAGEDCTTHPELASMRVDECDGDLVCVNGECADPEPAPLLMSGDPCAPEPPDAACGPGVYCGFDRVCHPYTADGTACESAWSCFGPSYCPEAAPDDPSICRPAHDLGDACDPVEFQQCGHEIVGEEMVSRWCDPRTLRCEDGHSFLCAALNDPVNW